MGSALLTVVLGGSIGGLAGAFPAYRIAREHIVDSLRRVG